MRDLEINGLTGEEETRRQYEYIEKARQYVAQKEKEAGRKLTCCVHTFGCQMNARDSEKLLGILTDIGYVETEDEHADFVIYNTCTVRENANNKVYGRLGYLSNFKKKNPHMMIALCGCMMQEPTVVEKIRKSYRFVDLVFGTHNIYKFAELLCNRMESDSMIIDIWKDVRGRERSREPKDIIREIEGLVADGVCEVMLLGQNVNSYGKNLEQPVTFAELLREVNKIEGLKRIRFMTSHPKDLSDDLILAMKECDKVCKHMHLPLQSGSSRILKIMNRHYDKEQYLTIVKKLREAIPDIALTTDIIVGFPGETEEDFQETLEVVKQVEYDSAFTFIYSKRTGTPAAAMEDQCDPAEVKRHFDLLLKEVQKISAKKAMALEGKVMEVLAEEQNTQDASLITGRLSNNSVVHFPGTPDMIGKLFMVKLTECKGFYYLGEIAENA